VVGAFIIVAAENAFAKACAGAESPLVQAARMMQRVRSPQLRRPGPIIEMRQLSNGTFEPIFLSRELTPVTLPAAPKPIAFRTGFSTSGTGRGTYIPTPPSSVENVLHQEFKLELQSSAAEIRQAHRVIYDQFKALGGQIDTTLRNGELKFKWVNGEFKQVLGEYHASTNTIYLYTDSNLGTLSEELVHFSQTLRRGLLFSRRLSAEEAAEMELEVGIVLRQWGYRPTK
jgi:hypothetical protein